MADLSKSQEGNSTPKAIVQTPHELLATEDFRAISTDLLKIKNDLLKVVAGLETGLRTSTVTGAHTSLRSLLNVLRQVSEERANLFVISDAATESVFRGLDAQINEAARLTFRHYFALGEVLGSACRAIGRFGDLSWLLWQLERRDTEVMTQEVKGELIRQALAPLIIKEFEKGVSDNKRLFGRACRILERFREDCGEDQSLAAQRVEEYYQVLFTTVRLGGGQLWRAASLREYTESIVARATQEVMEDAVDELDARNSSDPSVRRLTWYPSELSVTRAAFLLSIVERPMEQIQLFLSHFSPMIATVCLEYRNVDPSSDAGRRQIELLARGFRLACQEFREEFNRESDPQPFLESLFSIRPVAKEVKRFLLSSKGGADESEFRTLLTYLVSQEHGELDPDQPIGQIKELLASGVSETAIRTLLRTATYGDATLTVRGLRRFAPADIEYLISKATGARELMSIGATYPSPRVEGEKMKLLEEEKELTKTSLEPLVRKLARTTFGSIHDSLRSCKHSMERLISESSQAGAIDESTAEHARGVVANFEERFERVVDLSFRFGAGFSADGARRMIENERFLLIASGLLDKLVCVPSSRSVVVQLTDIEEELTKIFRAGFFETDVNRKDPHLVGPYASINRGLLRRKIIEAASEFDNGVGVGSWDKLKKVLHLPEYDRVRSRVADILKNEEFLFARVQPLLESGEVGKPLPIKTISIRLALKSDLHGAGNQTATCAGFATPSGDEMRLRVDLTDLVVERPIEQSSESRICAWIPAWCGTKPQVLIYNNFNIAPNDRVDAERLNLAVLTFTEQYLNQTIPCYFQDVKHRNFTRVTIGVKTGDLPSALDLPPAEVELPVGDSPETQGRFPKVSDCDENQRLYFADEIQPFRRLRWRLGSPVGSR